MITGEQKQVGYEENREQVFNGLIGLIRFLHFAWALLEIPLVVAFISFLFLDSRGHHGVLEQAFFHASKESAGRIAWKRSR